MTRTANLGEIVAAQGVVQPLASGTRVREELVLEIRLRRNRIDVLALHHEALVQVARRALMGKPDDAGIDARGQHEADLDVKPAADERGCDKRGVQDQAARGLRTRALDREGDRRSEAEASDIEMIRAGIGRSGERSARESWNGMPTEERRGTSEAGEVRRDHRPPREQDIEPVVEVLSRSDEPVTEEQWWARTSCQIAQAPALVLREPLFESVHGRGHSVSICAR